MSGAIDKAAGSKAARVGLDCSQVESLDDGTLGMLVIVARIAQRRGARVTLIRASVRLRAELDAAGVSHFFDWRRRHLLSMWRLRTASPSGQGVFSVCDVDDADRVACLDHAPTGTVIERLVAAGGLTMRASDLRAGLFVWHCCIGASAGRR